MTGRPWTARERRRLAVLYHNGMTVADLARALDRTPKAINHKLCQFRVTRPRARYRLVSEQTGADARSGLRAEIVAALAERGTTAPYRRGPLEW